MPRKKSHSLWDKQTDDERHEAAQWYFYKWLSRAELDYVPKLPFQEPGPGEI